MGYCSEFYDRWFLTRLRDLLVKFTVAVAIGVVPKAGHVRQNQNHGVNLFFTLRVWKIIKGLLNSKLKKNKRKDTISLFQYQFSSLITRET